MFRLASVLASVRDGSVKSAVLVRWAGKASGTPAFDDSGQVDLAKAKRREQRTSCEGDHEKAMEALKKNSAKVSLNSLTMTSIKSG